MTITKQNCFKRGLSLLLALMMFMSVINVTAFAEGAEPKTPIEKIDVPVEDGVYYANLDLLQASNPNQYSMGNAALRGSTSFKQKQPDDTYSKSIIVVKDNKATAIVEFMPMGYIGLYGFMMELESVDAKHLTQWGGVYDGNATFTPANVLAKHMSSDGKTIYDAYNDPESVDCFNGNKTRPAGFGYDYEREVDISNQPYSHILALDVTPIHICFASNDPGIPSDISEYTRDNAAYVHVFVPVMFSISPTSGDQYARLMVDWTTLEKIEEPEKNLQYALWSAKQIEQNDYTNASYMVLQNTIHEITTKLENIWPNQTISMSGTGFNAQPKLEQKEYSDSEKLEMAEKLNEAVSALELKGEKETLNILIARAKEISEEFYTQESYAEMKEALDAAISVRDNEDAGISAVDIAVQSLEDKIDLLIYRDADYTSVNAAIEAIPAYLFSICTKETAQVLQDAKDAVDWTLNITEQSKVEEYARVIRAAINGLEYLGADYTAVSTAIADIPADLSVYTDETAQAVRDAKDAVDWTKNKTEQSVVDAYARAVEDAVGKLVFKPADYTAVDAAIAKVPEDLAVYTDETVCVLNAAVNDVVRGKDMSERKLVDNYAKAIEAAINALAYRSADYTAVTKALDRIPSDFFLYADETVQAVEDARNAVELNKTITEQETVDAYADAIEDAISALKYKPADYSAVDNALAGIPSDLSGYTESSVHAVRDAQNAVVRGKNITEQYAVDSMAKRIEEAIASLELKASPDKLNKNNLEDGVYSVYGEMIKINRQDKSMSNEAINHTIKLTVENGKYYLTLDFQGLHYLNRFGYLAKLAYYDNGYTYGQYGKIEGSLIPAEVLSTQKNADGSDVIDEFNRSGGSSAGLLYPDQMKFPLVSDALNDPDGYVPLHVFVPVMEDISEGTGDQDVLLKLDFTTLTKTTEDDPGFQPDEPIEQSPAVDAIDSVTGVKIHADKGVFEEGVKLVIKEITMGADYDNAVSAFSEVGKKFKMYEIHFEDSDGNEVQPNGTVSVSYPLPAGYDAENVVLYRINSDGSKTLIKGVAKDGYYTVIAKSFGKLALVRKESVITDNQHADNLYNGNTGTTNNGNDNNVPGSYQSEVTAPQTGDNSNLELWLMLMFASAGMIAVLTFTRKRRINEGE